VGIIIRAKTRNPVQRGANPKWLRHLASARLRNAAETLQNLFLELEISCSIRLSFADAYDFVGVALCPLLCPPMIFFEHI
jgi:hypothetical protein